MRACIVILCSAANFHGSFRRIEIQQILQILITQVLKSSAEVQTCYQSSIQKNIILWHIIVVFTSKLLLLEHLLKLLLLLLNIKLIGVKCIEATHLNLAEFNLASLSNDIIILIHLYLMISIEFRGEQLIRALHLHHIFVKLVFTSVLMVAYIIDKILS